MERTQTVMRIRHDVGECIRNVPAENDLLGLMPFV